MNESAVAQQFEQHLAPVLSTALRVALRLTTNRDDAEDLVQDASIQAFRAFASFTPGTNFRAWFLKILVNRFLNRKRSDNRAPQSVPLDDITELFLYEHSRRAGLLRRDDPAALVMQKIDGAAIHAALNALPDEFRAVAVLYFLEELPYEAIAEVLGCPLGTVRSRLHRARKQLQKSLWDLTQQQK